MVQFLILYTLLMLVNFFFFFNDTATTEIYTLSLHDALPIWPLGRPSTLHPTQHEHGDAAGGLVRSQRVEDLRSEEHTSELQSRQYLVCRLLLEKKKKTNNNNTKTNH